MLPVSLTNLITSVLAIVPPSKRCYLIKSKFGSVVLSIELKMVMVFKELLGSGYMRLGSRGL